MPIEDAASRSEFQIRGVRRVHCSYHKCLTVYFEKVFKRLYGSRLGPDGTYRHFDSRLDDFYLGCQEHAVASLNNHCLDLDRFDDVRVTRFIRDPRDLIVSGYFYHRRSAEPWCDVVGPTTEDWRVVNGTIPDTFAPDICFSQYLNEVSLEEGLLAELQFRRRHFDSMRAWRIDDPRVQTFRYEEILGNEAQVFDRIFRFYGLTFVARQIGSFHARRLRASKRTRSSDHIRDPSAGQWRQVLTTRVIKRFHEEHGDLVERLGYARQ